MTLPLCPCPKFVRLMVAWRLAAGALEFVRFVNVEVCTSFVRKIGGGLAGGGWEWWNATLETVSTSLKLPFPKTHEGVARVPAARQRHVVFERTKGAREPSKWQPSTCGVSCAPIDRANTHRAARGACRKIIAMGRPSSHGSRAPSPTASSTTTSRQARHKSSSRASKDSRCSSWKESASVFHEAQGRRLARYRRGRRAALREARRSGPVRAARTAAPSAFPNRPPTTFQRPATSIRRRPGTASSTAADFGLDPPPFARVSRSLQLSLGGARGPLNRPQTSDGRAAVRPAQARNFSRATIGHRRPAGRGRPPPPALSAATLGRARTAAVRAEPRQTRRRARAPRTPMRTSRAARRAV